MPSVSSVNALQASIAQAERQVQQDQVRVNQDASRLEQSRQQLADDKQTLADTKRQSAQASNAASSRLTTTPNLTPAIEKPSRAEQVLPPELSGQPKAQINAQGQTIGKLINITA